MRVIFYFEDQIHYTLAAGSRIANYAKGLMDAGAEVVIIMPFAFRARKEDVFEQEGLFEGVNYIYSHFYPDHPKYAANFPFSILIFYLKKATSNLKVLYDLKKQKGDVIWLYSGSNVNYLLIKLLNFNKFIVHELCEIPFYYIKKQFLKRLKRFIRIKILSFCYDLYVPISANLEQYLIKEQPNKQYLKIPILLNPNDFEETKFRFKENENFTIVHTGSLTERKDGILSILNAIGTIKQIFGIIIELHLTGFKNASEDKINIENLIKEYELSNQVTFHGFLDKDTLRVLQAKADMAIIFKIMNEQNFYNFPTKLAEYLQLGVPVLITPVGEAINYLVDGENAFILEDSNVNCLVNKLVTIVENRSTLLKVGIKGKEVVNQNFNSLIIGKKLFKYLERNV